MLVIPVFLPHRGCPHDCLFCNQRKISGERGRGGGPETVSSLIEEWLEHSRLRDRVQVAFFGGSFTCLPVVQQAEYLGAVQPYLDSGEVHTIRVSTRPDCISGPVLENLKKFRVDVVELGVQSFSDSVLRKSLRGHTADQSRHAFTSLKTAGIQVGLQLMVGLPGESRLSFLRGIAEVCRLRPDFVRLYPVLVVRDSGLERLYLEKKYAPLSLSMAVAVTARAVTILEGAGIKVIRTGLQPSGELQSSVLAGPYHPAFGELVRSRLWLKKIRKRCSMLKENESLVVRLSSRDVSAAVGNRRSNLQRLCRLGYGGRIRIAGEKEIPQGTVHYVVN